jgi:serine/threonine-protein kinase
MGIKCPKCNTDNPDTLKFCGECGTQIVPLEEAPVTETLETPKEELTTGSTFAGRYQIIEELGKGGMGKVYKAHDTEIKEKVALKLLKPEIAADEKTIERFRNEIRLARKIVHKNVGRMYDLSKADGTYFITMEYVEGQDLRGLIRQSRQLTVGTTINIAKQVSEGLAEAHKLGVVHRDLKPSNIMIDKEGNVRIMDFGIARSLTAKGITGAGVMIGTPEYMSPEQAEVKEVDQRSDIYSLGVILYEMVTGRVPFEGETPLGIAMKHKSETPKDPRELNAQLPEDLNRVIMRCLEKDKEKRYQSAGEVRSELENIEKGIPTTERIVSERKPLTSQEITVTFSAKRLLIPGLAIIAVAIIGIFLWHPWSRIEAPPKYAEKPSVAVLPFVDFSPQKDQDYLCNGIVDSIISALSNIKDLRVPARGSSSVYKKGEKDFKKIGEMLNVDFVLDGTLQKSGNILRITPRLIGVADGSIIWSEKFDEEIRDVFDIQDDITRAIVDKLKVNILASEKEKVYKRNTESTEAYNQYLLGQFHLAKRTVEDYYKAYDYFNKAIELDSKYALVYVGLADTYILHELQGAPRSEAQPKAEEAIAKALEIDENIAEAHTTLGWIKFYYHWDWEGAEREFKRAIELNPNYATAHQWYAEYLNNMGRFDEALLEIEKAHELAPISLIINVVVGFIHYYARQYDKAILQYKKTIEMDPSFWMTYDFLSQVYRQKGMYDKALETLQKWKEIGNLEEEALVDRKVYIYALMGRKKEALQFFEDRKSNLNNREKAHWYFVLGDIDQGIAYLEKEYEAREGHMRFIKVRHQYDNIRNDPRYKEIVRKMKLD